MPITSCGAKPQALICTSLNDDARLAVIRMNCNESAVPPIRDVVVQSKGGGWGVGQRVGFLACQRRLLERFPEYIADYNQRETLKYRQCPSPDEPVAAWIKQVLNHARAKWSAEIDGGERRQLVDWLEVKFSSDKFRWRPTCINHARAEQRIRKWWGLPAVPTSDWKRLKHGRGP